MGSFSGHETRLVVSLCRPVETRGDWELGALCRSYVISFNPNKQGLELYPELYNHSEKGWFISLVHTFYETYCQQIVRDSYPQLLLGGSRPVTGCITVIMGLAR